MGYKFARLYLYSAGSCLLLTGLAKIISCFGGTGILQLPDPIFTISYRYILIGTGITEIFVAMVCFLGKRQLIKSTLVAWLATCFLIYRLGLAWVVYQKPCKCLGNITEELHIPPEAANIAIELILIYLLIGSYTVLYWLWRQNCAISSLKQPPG